MTRALNHENGGLANIATFVIGQVGMVTLALAWVWVAGLRFLWRSGEPLWRGMACAYGLLFVLFTLTAGAKTYYLAAAYVYLLAAGAVAIDGWLQARPGRLRNLMLATALTTAAVLPAVLPVLPPADTGWTYKTSPTLDETIGWPQLARTADYAEAGAINELGRGTGLPTAVSGHNSEWWWGPGNPHATTVVAVAPAPIGGTGYAAYLSQFFTSSKPGNRVPGSHQSPIQSTPEPDGLHPGSSSRQADSAERIFGGTRDGGYRIRSRPVIGYVMRARGSRRPLPCSASFGGGWYCSITLAGIRPRSLTARPSSLAHARTSPLRCRPAEVRGVHRARPRLALRACSMNGASFVRKPRAFFALRSISFGAAGRKGLIIADAALFGLFWEGDARGR